MKRIIIIGLSLLLVLGVAVGCKKLQNNPQPTPIVTTDPPVSPPADVGGSGTAGNVEGSGNTDTGNAGTPATGTGDLPAGSESVMTIPDFKAGTEVLVSDVPEIKTALQDQYEGATISRITHGLFNNAQVYIVEYTLQDGAKQTAHIYPDGKIAGIGDNAVATP